LELEPDGLALRCQAPDFAAHLVARALLPPIEVEDQIPFGSGWISWRALPRLAAAGTMHLGESTFDVSQSLLYHDHNWGRWHWGDRGAGWAWAALLGDEVTVVLAATAGRHRRAQPRLWLWWRGGRHSLPVSIQPLGRLRRLPRRVPGAMAAMHGGRRAPALPERVRLLADDRVDRVEVTITVDDACQLIAADPARPGVTFIHEMVGEFRLRARVSGRFVEDAGPVVFEHVD
jgi:hypothetical protein